MGIRRLLTLGIFAGHAGRRAMFPQVKTFFQNGDGGVVSVLWSSCGYGFAGAVSLRRALLNV